MIKQIIQMLSGKQWLLYGNSNLKSTADTLFFQYNGHIQGKVSKLQITLAVLIVLQSSFKA